VGTLFQDKREKELVQLAHRIRPVPATYPKYIDVLTSVPTDLSIDTLATFSELTSPLYEELSIEHSNGAIRLLQHICDALDDDDPAPLIIRDDGAVANTRSELRICSGPWGGCDEADGGQLGRLSGGPRTIY